MKHKPLDYSSPEDRAEGMERLRTLYSVIAGVPSELTDLHNFFYHRPLGEQKPTIKRIQHTCGSTACALGLAALYPPFQELGLGVGRWHKVIFTGSFGNFDAASKFFALEYCESAVVFGDREALANSDSAQGRLREKLYKSIKEHFTDKRIALHRIRRFLEINSVITRERSLEFAQLEKEMK